MSDVTDPERALFLEQVGRLGPAVLQTSSAFEQVARHLHPPRIDAMRRELAPVVERLDQALGAFRETAPPDGLGEFVDQLCGAALLSLRAGRLFLGQEAEGSAAGDGIAAVLGAMREHARAQAALFPLRQVLPPFDAWFIEPGFESRLAELARPSEAEAGVGLFNASNGPEERGGFTLYVPEDYTPDRAWPLVVALHGGFGHGGDFLWTWLREARSRGWLLMAPTSRGTTWSLQGTDVDAASLDSMLDFVRARWRVDASQMLLTGLSDGATYTLLYGLRSDSPFTALAPACGVLHPANFVNGNVERAAGRRIRLIHGALDWMFPIEVAREAAKALEKAGAALVFEEIEDLSHAYPRERNGPILEWAASSAS